MELFESSSSIEDYLINKATLSNRAIGGSLELLPLCNMKCKMCYIYHDRKEMEKEGQLLDNIQWTKIAQEMKEYGVLFLLLTGGEPLVYPQFKILYKQLIKMGFIISINTNATLIDAEMADFFANNRCRKLNITIYGKDDETYQRLCGNPNGFTQLSNAVQLLNERNIPFGLSFTPTPLNYMQFEEIQEIAQNWKTRLVYTSYLFPPIRRNNADTFRMTPQEAAETMFVGLKNEYPGMPLDKLAANALSSIKGVPCSKMNGLNCRAGHSGFWATWKGELTLCSMIPEPKISLLENSFIECWKYIVDKATSYKPCQKCIECNKRNACHTCFAACFSETGHTDQIPDYLCNITDAYIELLKKYSNESFHGE